MPASTTATRTATLVAVTPEARASLGDQSDVRLTEFPFKIGRESRIPARPAALWSQLERRLGLGTGLNDLYLLEAPTSTEHHISREHCAIEIVDGTFFVVDRGSACGTSVVVAHLEEGRGSIERTDAGGNRRGGRSKLHDGDLIVIGTPDSPFVFRFQIVDPL